MAKTNVRKSNIDQKNRKKTGIEKVELLIRDLRKYKSLDNSFLRAEKLDDIHNKIISIGEPAVLPMLEILNNYTDPIWESAAFILGEIGEERAIMPLVNALEDFDNKDKASEALVKIGPVCIPEVIRKVQYRIKNPIKDGKVSSITGWLYSLSEK